MTILIKKPQLTPICEDIRVSDRKHLAEIAAILLCYPKMLCFVTRARIQMTAVLHVNFQNGGDCSTFFAISCSFYRLHQCKIDVLISHIFTANVCLIVSFL